MLSAASRNSLRRAAAAPRAPLVVGAPRYSSSTHGNDPEVLDREKHRNLSSTQHKTSTTIGNAPGWNEYLASASEAAVKADRSDHNIGDMQSKTVKHIKERHHSADSAEPVEQATNTARMSNGGSTESHQATYERDEISGPLGSAEGKSDGVRQMTVDHEVFETVVTRPAFK
ncbi:hypothetical protein B0H21DRAFT_832935 [Amylocystis lapponica]|nr:hypothetical protein B0H21DRAFT_832935 [Amylocystis lapponica]